MEKSLSKPSAVKPTGARRDPQLARGTASSFPLVKPGEPRRLTIYVGGDSADCPKCGTARRDHGACTRCGLAASRMDAYMMTVEASVPQAVQDAWRRVREGWDVQERHDELLKLSTQHECYAWVAAKYREVGRMRNCDPIAEAHLERMRRAAEVTLAIRATARDQQSSRGYRALNAMVIIVVIGVIASCVYARVRPIEVAPSAMHQAASLESQ